MTRKIECPRCHGVGHVEEEGERIGCPDCAGWGRIVPEDDAEEREPEGAEDGS